MISLLHVISLDGTQYHLRDNLDVISPHSTPLGGRVSVVVTIFHHFTKILRLLYGMRVVVVVQEEEEREGC